MLIAPSWIGGSACPFNMSLRYVRASKVLNFRLVSLKLSDPECFKVNVYFSCARVDYDRPRHFLYNPKSTVLFLMPF